MEVRKTLDDKTTKAYEQAKETFGKNFGKFDDPKTDEKTVDKLLARYGKSDPGEKKSMRNNEFVELKAKNPSLDLDVYLVQKFAHKDIPAELLTRA